MLIKENVSSIIEDLLFYAQEKLHLSEEDSFAARNNLMDLLEITLPAEPSTELKALQKDILDPLIDYATASNLTDEENKILFETKIMGFVTPSPSAVISQFDYIAAKGNTEKATDFLRELSVNSNYIRKVDIDRNLKWTAPGKMGDLIITINLAKPEKDPKIIAEQREVGEHKYPQCQLCATNVGYKGSLTHPARQTLRVIPMFLNDEKWYLQYSPYVYYKDHIIALSKTHRPMVINSDTFVELIDFVSLFPHFFCGSNADLPIVGGSILSHEHFQGGAKVLPMLKRGERMEFTHSEFKQCRIQILDWYNSVVRIVSPSYDEIIKSASHILNVWKEYSDESVGIIAKTDNTPHNTITPIASVNKDKEFTLDLILRNNRTDKEHPYGIYHPTEDMHNIKKEGIGLIEAMGIFILPGRLNKEISEICELLQVDKPINFEALSKPDHQLSKHFDMIVQLAITHGFNLTKENSCKIVTDYINETCRKILECTAVFKNTEEGQEAFRAFLKAAGCRKKKQKKQE